MANPEHKQAIQQRHYEERRLAEKRAAEANLPPPSPGRTFPYEYVGGALIAIGFGVVGWFGLPENLRVPWVAWCVAVLLGAVWFFVRAWEQRHAEKTRIDDRFCIRLRHYADFLKTASVIGVLIAALITYRFLPEPLRPPTLFDKFYSDDIGNFSFCESINVTPPGNTHVTTKVWVRLVHDMKARTWTMAFYVPDTSKAADIGVFLASNYMSIYRHGNHFGELLEIPGSSTPANSFSMPFSGTLYLYAQHDLTDSEKSVVEKAFEKHHASLVIVENAAAYVEWLEMRLRPGATPMPSATVGPNGEIHTSFEMVQVRFRYAICCQRMASIPSS